MKIINNSLGKFAMAAVLALAGLGLGATNANAAPYHRDVIAVEVNTRPAAVRYADGYRDRDYREYREHRREKRCERRERRRWDRDDYNRR